MNVTRVPISVPTLAPEGTTNAYVVGESPALLVDPAAPSDDLDTACDARDVGHVAVTHTHPDHAGAVERYAERTGATIWARRGREAGFERATGIAPDRTFGEGTTVPVGEAAATVLDVPGHAADHVALAVPAEGDRRRGDENGRRCDRGAEAILCGDVAVVAGSVVVGAPEGDMRAYLTALRRLRARNPATLYSGHGPVIHDPPSTLERLIRHRLDRERRVLAAVETGASDPDAVVDRAYDKDLTGVRNLARVTVVAHIEKLAVEGRLRWDPSAERVAPTGAGVD